MSICKQDAEEFGTASDVAKSFELLTILVRGQLRAQHVVNPQCRSSGTARQRTKTATPKLTKIFHLQPRPPDFHNLL